MLQGFNAQLNAYRCVREHALNAAEVHQALNQHPKAIEKLQQAEALLRTMGHPQADAMKTKLDAARAASR